MPDKSGYPTQNSTQVSDTGAKRPATPAKDESARNWKGSEHGSAHMSDHRPKKGTSHL